MGKLLRLIFSPPSIPEVSGHLLSRNATRTGRGKKNTGELHVHGGQWEGKFRAIHSTPLNSTETSVEHHCFLSRGSGSVTINLDLCQTPQNIYSNGRELLQTTYYSCSLLIYNPQRVEYVMELLPTRLWKLTETLLQLFRKVRFFFFDRHLKTVRGNSRITSFLGEWKLTLNVQ